jgi:uncharacterized surface anchored protein
MTKIFSIRCVRIIAASLCLCATPLMAQFRSSIEGAITDASGAVLADVTVVLINTATGVSQSAQTNAEGYFRFPTLPPGSYKLTATKAGFQTLNQENVSLLAQETRTVPMVL